MEISNTSSSGEANYVMNMWEVDKDRLYLMHQKITEPPRLLSNFASKSSCCIFRVPRSLIEINGEAYKPHIVSIGPYYRGEPQFTMIEEHKWRYLGSLLLRTKSKGLELEDYLKAIAEVEIQARECYSETIHLSSHEFIEMMVLDGCFIVELFRKASKLYRFEPDDPLVTMAWIVPFFYRDFIGLENQMPFFVLERLFQLSKLDLESDTTLPLLALQFFNRAMRREDEVIEKHRNLQGKHLLDLVRSSFIPPEYEDRQMMNTKTHIIHCVSKLRRAGIKLKPGKGDSFLVVKFRHGVIEMPTITIDDFMSSILLNCVAYEQCHRSCTNHFTTFTTLLDCLVNTWRDVEYLCDQNIIENSFGDDAELARFINNLGKDVAFDIDMCYLSKLFNDVHDYYKNNWHVAWAGFKYTYFDTPWSFISAFAAFVLLIFTLAQTLYTFLGYYKDRNPRSS
ncbi:hypothetical protein FNV43_RR15622 [Rhamnella rubrinervis]|uniref:Uncharacterized protein n=1 Tax=Rhamnella rubrinervis TaxID=2594499 RepID=A0A8K0E1V5_9ROSA|nr:hypothetical protein FNV43_RR15622 [Rhamnella rubrinervis]